MATKKKKSATKKSGNSCSPREISGAAGSVLKPTRRSPVSLASISRRSEVIRSAVTSSRCIAFKV